MDRDFAFFDSLVSIGFPRVFSGFLTVFSDFLMVFLWFSRVFYEFLLGFLCPEVYKPANVGCVCSLSRIFQGTWRNK